jgi:hypothetical protein
MKESPLASVVTSLQNLSPADYEASGMHTEQQIESMNSFRNSLLDIVVSANLKFIPASKEL